MDWLWFLYEAPWWADLPGAVIFILGVLPIGLVWVVALCVQTFLHWHLVSYWVIGLALSFACYAMLPWTTVSTVIMLIGVGAPLLVIINAKRARG